MSVVKLRVLKPGTGVKIRNPQPGERGLWHIVSRVQNSGFGDPAYVICFVGPGRRHGKQRIVRRSRLTIKRNS